MTTAVETNVATLSPVVQKLKVLQADATVLYFKSRSYHWNVTGKQFFQLHALFEKFYGEIAEVGDSLAERLRAMGDSPAFTVAEQLRVAELHEDPSPESVRMVPFLLADLEKMTRSLRDLSKAAQHVGDVATINLADSIADKNEKTIWMLRVYLTEPGTDSKTAHS